MKDFKPVEVGAGPGRKPSPLCRLTIRDGKAGYRSARLFLSAALVRSLGVAAGGCVSLEVNVKTLAVAIRADDEGLFRLCVPRRGQPSLSLSEDGLSQLGYSCADKGSFWYSWHAEGGPGGWHVLERVPREG